MTTILHSKTGNILLASYGTGNPFEIYAGTTIVAHLGVAIYGDASQVFTLSNAGYVYGQYDAIALKKGGVITNTGSITGENIAINIAGGAGHITNSGSVVGWTNDAIVMSSGGTVTNQTSGTIVGASSSQGGNSVAVFISGLSGTVVNQGFISQPDQSGRVRVGVVLNAGGSLSNTAPGTIAGGTYGAELLGAGTATNSGLIEGRVGVAVSGSNGWTVINEGTIESTSGATGVALKLGASGDRLILETGSAFIGKTTGGGGALELAAPNGTLSGLGSMFSGFGAYTVDKGAAWTLAGASNKIASGLTLTNNGTLTDTGGLINFGAILAPAGNGAGVTLAAGGTINNGQAFYRAAMLSGSVGVLATGAATVINYGTIASTAGASGVAVQFTNSGDRLIMAAGTLTGRAVGGEGTLEWAGAGTVSGLGVSPQYSGFANYVVDLGLTLTGSSTLAAGTTLSDGGDLALAGSLTNLGSVQLNGVIEAAVSGETLTNSATLSGAGTIGAASYKYEFYLTNQTKGVIDATGTANALDIDHVHLTNAGLVEATGAAGMILFGDTVSGSGILLAATGSKMTLQADWIYGGTLATAGSGTIFASDLILDGATTAVTNTGDLVVVDDSGLSLKGAVVNSGTIRLNAATHATSLYAVNATLSGGGQVILSDNQLNSIGSTFETLTNVDNTISGSGTIGTVATNYPFHLTNQTKGVIDATGTAYALNLNHLNLTNAGLIEAAGAAGMILFGDTVVNSGTLLAAPGSRMTLEADWIYGGTLATAGSGAIYANGLFLNGQTTAVTNSGDLVVMDDGGVSLNGAVVNSGTIRLNATAHATSLYSSNATLSGGGQVILSDNALNTVESTYETLVNIDNTLSGAGIIGVPTYTKQIYLTNETKGVIDATGTANALDIDHVHLTNAGLIEAAGAAGMILFGDTVSGSGILLAATGSKMTLQADWIYGGTLATAGSGTIFASDLILNGATTAVTNTGDLVVVDDSGLSLKGTVVNSGTIRLNAATHATSLYAVNATLSGGGQVILSDNQLNSIGSTFETLTNVDNTVSGSGTIGTVATNYPFHLTNQAKGVIDATGTAYALNLNHLNLTNAGLIEATGTAGMILFGDTVSGSGILLAATGSKMTLQADVIASGTLATAGSGTIYTAGYTIFEGLASAVTNSGEITVLANNALSVEGVFDNSGTITVSNASGINAAGAVTLTNSGKIIATQTAIAFGSTSGRLVAMAGSTITGAVRGGGGLLDLANGVGAVSGLGSTGTVSGAMAMTFSGFGAYEFASGSWSLTGTNFLAAGAALTANAKISNTGALTVSGKIAGKGSLTVAGGTLAIEAGAAITVAAWSLNGGVTSLGESMTFKGIFSEAAAATLTVASGDKLTLAGTSTLAGLVNGAGGVSAANATLNSLTVGGTTGVTLTGTATQTGTVTIGDTTGSAASLTIAKGATWSIGGSYNILRGTATSSNLSVAGTLIKSGASGTSTIALATVDTGAIEAAAGTLDLTNALSGAGGLRIDSGAALEVDGTAAKSLTATFNGATATLALASPSTFAATIAGFAATDTIDLLKITATGARINAKDQLIILSGSTTVATLTLTGTYTNASLSVGSDGKGGTKITLLTAASVPPPAAPVSTSSSHAMIAAMASLAATTAAAPVAAALADPVRPMLLAARTVTAD